MGDFQRTVIRMLAMIEYHGLIDVNYGKVFGGNAAVDMSVIAVKIRKNAVFDRHNHKGDMRFFDPQHKGIGADDRQAPNFSRNGPVCVQQQQIGAFGHLGADGNNTVNFVSAFIKHRKKDVIRRSVAF